MNQKQPFREAIRDHRELQIYQKAFEAAMTIFELSQKFPVEERYALTDQIRRSSRSVCANLAEAGRKRRYKAAFMAKLNDCEAEAAELKPGLNLRLNVAICQLKMDETSMELTTKFEQV